MPGVVLFSGVCAVIYFVVGFRFVVMSFVFIMIVCDGLVVVSFMTSIFTVARAQDE